MKILDRITNCIITFMLGILCGIFVTIHYCNPVKYAKDSKIKIDSLTTINDSIKLKIKKLDSTKNAKIIEVSTLDNDSTLKLFYKLVSE